MTPPLDSATVDLREADNFDKLSGSWWDPTGPFWPLHRLNVLRMQWIVAQLRENAMATEDRQKPLSGLRVLDLGCGGGILSESLANLGAMVHGVDVVARNIESAKAHAAESRLAIRYTLETAEILAAEGNSYDLVFNMEVVEHVADFPVFMDASCRLVKPGGGMFVSTINRNVKSWLTAIVGAEYVLRWLPKGTHRYSLLRKPDEVRTLLEAGGLETTGATGVRVNPMTRLFSLTSSLDVNYMVFGRKPAHQPPQ